MATATALGYTTASAWTVADGDGGAAGTIKTANTAMDGSGTVTTLKTAGGSAFAAGTNGASIISLRFTAGSGQNVPTVLRIFKSNGSGYGTPANNSLWKEVSLPATNVNQTTATPVVEIPGPQNLAAATVIFFTIGTTVSAGWKVDADVAQY